MKRRGKMKLKEIELIRSVFWDYYYTDSEIEKIVSEINSGVMSDENFFLRLLENLYWYDLTGIFPIKNLLPFLKNEILKKIRNKRLREEYETVKSILLGKPVPFSRWNNLSDERRRHGLLSDRGNGFKQGIF